MSSLTFLIGLIGSLILVTGSAWPDRTIKHATRSVKNWLFALGGILMLIYSILNYLDGGPIFFVILQMLVNLGSVFMMLDVPDTIDTPIMAGAGVLLIIWSLSLFQGYDTLLFILGLSGIGMGYVMKTGSFRRNLALTLGSILIAIFSYLGANWIFFWLNTFFAIFSGYYALKVRR